MTHADFTTSTPARATLPTGDKFKHIVGMTEYGALYFLQVLGLGDYAHRHPDNTAGQAVMRDFAAAYGVLDIHPAIIDAAEEVGISFSQLVTLAGEFGGLHMPRPAESFNLAVVEAAVEVSA